MGSLFVKKEKKSILYKFPKKNQKQNKTNKKKHPGAIISLHKAFSSPKIQLSRKEQKNSGSQEVQSTRVEQSIKKKNKTNKHRSNELPLQAKRNNKSEEFSHYSENFKLS